MLLRTLFLPSLALAAVLLATNSAHALGFALGETKEELQLDYEVSVEDHGTGRVSVVLTIADEGRLGPLNSVDLMIPSRERNGPVDLSLSLDVKEVDGKKVARVHLIKHLAERAEFQLKTSTLDGKQEPLTWYYHQIPLKEYMKGGREEDE